MLTPPLGPLFCCVVLSSEVEDTLHRGCRGCSRTRRSSRATRWDRNAWGTTSRVVVDLIHLLHPAFIAPMTWLSTDLTVVAGNVALAFALALHRVIVITLSFAFVILASFRVTFRLSKLALVEEVLSLAFVLLTTHPVGCGCGASDPLCLCLLGFSSFSTPNHIHFHRYSPDLQ